MISSSRTFCVSNYSGFEVTCPDCDLQSALDHVARDVVRHLTRIKRAQLGIFCESIYGAGIMNPSDIEQLFGCQSPVAGNYTSMYSCVCQLTLV